MPTKKRLIERAYGAWLKYPLDSGSTTPTLEASTVEEYDDRVYVFLRRGKQIVAVFRYVPPTDATRDQLIRVRRYWPGPYGRQRVAA